MSMGAWVLKSALFILYSTVSFSGYPDLQKLVTNAAVSLLTVATFVALFFWKPES